MSRLLELREQLDDTSAMLAQVERAVAEDKGATPSLMAMARSLQKRRSNLETDFLRITDEIGVDVCSYRMFASTGSKLKIGGLATALGNFQTAVSVTLDAEKKGPKQSTRVPAEIADASAFDFAYTFSGSVGVVMTLSNERLLVGDSELDRSIQTVFELAQAKSAEEIQAFARRLGPAPIRMIYKWANDHVKYGLGADIDWRRGEEIRAQLFIEYSDLRHLQETIAQVSEERDETITVSGILEGADVPRRTFHMTTDSGGDIRGTFEDAISSSQTVELPKPYKATIVKTTSIRYSTEEEKVVYFLVHLDPITDTDM